MAKRFNFMKRVGDDVETFYPKTATDNVVVETSDGEIPLDDVLDLGAIDNVWWGDCKRPKLLVRNIHINSKDITKRGIDLSFKIDNVIYKKEFCSKVFYEKLICAEENKFNNKDLEIDIICSVKVFENGRAYICIEDCESNIIK